MAWHDQDPDLTVMLPAELAHEIIADGDAEEPIPLRGPLTDGTLGIVVEGINTASAAVSVGLGAAALRRFSTSVIGRLKSGGETGHIELRMRSANGERRLIVPLDDPNAENRILDFIIETLPGAGEEEDADADP